MVLRFLSERLLQLVSLVVWAACWAQATGFAGAALITLAMSSSRAPSPWGAPTLRASLSLGAIFLVGGTLLFFLRVRAPAIGQTMESAERRPARDLLLGGALLALSVAALMASADLLALWREAIGLMDRAGVWREFGSGGPASGLVLLPAFAILYTPTLAGLAALSLISLPLLLAVALVARSPRFRSLFTSAVICSAILVAAALVATDLFHRLAVLSDSALRSRSEPVAVEIAAGWRRAADVLVRAARWQTLILVGHLAWLPLVLRRESRSVMEEAAMVPPDPSSPPEFQASPPLLPTPEPMLATAIGAEAGHFGHSTVSAASPLRPQRGVRVLMGAVLLAMGGFMLAISAVDLLRPQARWVASEPEPGATLDSVPHTVSVTFGRKLAAESSLEVIQTLAGGNDPAQPGPGAGSVALNQRIDPGESRTLRTELTPGSGEGLYWVEWRAVSAGWGVPRRGSYAFRVGTSVPEHHLGERGRPNRETSENQRRRRSILLGGALLVLLGLVLPRLAPSGLET
jgi:methionine-rich copper-binding protein CopC